MMRIYLKGGSRKRLFINLFFLKERDTRNETT